jgi:hypothetical protein
MRRVTLALLGALAALAMPRVSDAGCGCDKPPPPRAAVRPFAGSVDQVVTLFDERLVAGSRYEVEFVSTTDGRADWSRARVARRRDMADGQQRSHLRVRVPDVSLGPCRISVWKDGVHLYTLGDEQFTVVAAPLPLHEFTETVRRDGYQTGVGRDGTIYILVDVAQVSEATTFTGAALGYPLRFGAQNVAIYNKDGFLMQLLDPNQRGLFRLTRGGTGQSDVLSYWRHEFQTYKREHRQVDARRQDDDSDWHADGSYHVDHDHLMIAISGSLQDGTLPAPGATPSFTLTISSSPDAL